MKTFSRRGFLRISAAGLTFLLTPTSANAAPATEAASFPSEKIDSLSSALSDYLQSQIMLGLLVDFPESIYVGNKIPTYIVSADGLYVDGPEIFPVYLDGVFSVFSVIDDTDSIQVSNALVGEINSEVSMPEQIALVYTSDSTYLISNNEAIKIAEFTSVSGRWATQLEAVSSIPVSSAGDPSYVPRSVLTRASGYYGCSVGFVSQNPPSNICWAASCACIINKINGTSLSAETVARNYYGSNYNRGLPSGAATNVLLSYGIGTYNASYLSDNALIKNFNNNSPIYSSWSVNPSGSHATAVYGKNVLSGVLSIMDPEYGFCTATTSGWTYAYTSLYSSKRLTCTGFVARFTS